MCGPTFNVKISVITLIAIGVVVRDVDAKRSRRIIGGKDAEDNEFPWMARLNVTNAIGLNYDCSGAIISSWHILTSAACLQNKTLNSIWTGANIRDYNVAVKSSPAKIIVHPKFSVYGAQGSRKTVNNVGIVVLDKYLQQDKNHDVILLTGKETEVGTRAVLPGWGLIGPSMMHQGMVLQKTHINIVLANLCSLKTENQLCGWATMKATPYFGDFGSPLVVDGRIVGILSSIQPIRGGESTYTDVYHHRDWIMHIVNETVKNVAGRENF